MVVSSFFFLNIFLKKQNKKQQKKSEDCGIGTVNLTASHSDTMRVT